MPLLTESIFSGYSSNFSGDGRVANRGGREGRDNIVMIIVFRNR